MVVKSSKIYHGIFVILFCSILFFNLLLLHIIDGFIVPFVTTLLLITISVRYWVSVGRTLIMDAEGCTVKFLWYRRYYRWIDLKTKRIEHYSNSLGYRQPYTVGAVFSVNRSKKPSWLMPADYSMLVHPFSYFFVYFDPQIRYHKWDVRVPDIYVVDELIFRKKMEDWNVAL